MLTPRSSEITTGTVHALNAANRTAAAGVESFPERQVPRRAPPRMRNSGYCLRNRLADADTRLRQPIDEGVLSLRRRGLSRGPSSGYSSQAAESLSPWRQRERRPDSRRESRLSFPRHQTIDAHTAWRESHLRASSVHLRQIASSCL